MSKNPRNEADTDWSQSKFRIKKAHFYANINNKNSVGNWFEDLLIWKPPWLGNNYNSNLCYWQLRQHKQRSSLGSVLVVKGTYWEIWVKQKKIRNCRSRKEDKLLQLYQEWSLLGFLYSSYFEKKRLLSSTMAFILCLVGTTLACGVHRNRRWKICIATLEIYGSYRHSESSCVAVK